MRRGTIGSVVQTLGTTLLVVSAELLIYALVYPLWADAQDRPRQPSSDPLPPRLAGAAAEDAASDGMPARVALLAPHAADIPLSEDAASTMSRGARFSPMQLPTFGRPVRLQIPSIGVDSAVEEVSIKNGEYEVPWWDVGHHIDSSYPGERGNSVFNGHVETINAGRVFARLARVGVGDVVFVYTTSHRVDWVVEDVRTVPSSDSSFILPTPDTRITLYTCTGRYDRLAAHYSHWLVVTGQMVDVVAL